MRARLIVATVLIVVAGGAWAITTRDQAPYDAAAVRASVQLNLVPAAKAQEVLDRLAGPGRLNAVHPIPGVTAEPALVGQLTLRTPANAPEDGQYALFVLDRATSKPLEFVFGVGPRGTNVGQGWDGRFDKVAEKYSWLRKLASVRDEHGGWTDPGGMALTIAPDTPGPITFLAVPKPGVRLTDPNKQFTIALVFLGDDEQVYWAEDLTPRSS